MVCYLVSHDTRARFLVSREPFPPPIEDDLIRMIVDDLIHMIVLRSQDVVVFVISRPKAVTWLCRRG